MAFSITKEEILHKGYVPFNYTSKKINCQNLVVAEHGQWVILNDAEFDLLENGELDRESKLFNLLEEKGIIITLKNEGIIENYYKERLSFLAQGVSLHIVILTKRCDHKCVYCHASVKNSDAKEFDMTKKTAKKTVDFIFQSPSKSIMIEFQGGETLLNFEVLQFIVGYAKEKNKKIKKNLKFSVVTNLRPMDDEKLDFLMKNDVSICTSLDGPADIHNANRICEDNKFNCHENVSFWIKKIREECNKQKKNWRIEALLTITKNSLKKPREIVDEYVKQGFVNMSVRDMKFLGFSSKNFGQIGYSPEEFIDFWKKCADYIIELNKKGVRIRERTMVIILSKILGQQDAGYTDMRSPCGACLSQLAYDYDGSIYSCDEGRDFDIFKVGNVSQEYPEVVGCDKSCMIISSSVISNTSCDECVWKPYCGICPVIGFSETNSLIPSVSEHFRCKVHDAQFNYIFEKIQDSEFQKIVKSWISL